MKDLELSFEPLPWEALIASAKRQISAAALLAAAEEATEEEFDEILDDLLRRHVMPDCGDLPKTGAVGEAALRLRQEEQWAVDGLHPDKLEETDPLRLYLEEVAATDHTAYGAMEHLSLSQTAQLALVNWNLFRVVELAKEFAGNNVLLLDLIQEGNLGLWEAVQEYTCCEFTVHRDWYIRFYMAAAVLRQARENGIGQKMRTALEDYTAVNERLLAELGRNPTVEEIAEGMHTDAEAVAVVAKMDADARRLRHIQQPRDDEQEKAEEDQAVEDTAYFRMRQRIMELLSALSEDDAKLLTLRFGLDSGLPKTTEETGKIMGLTPDEVMQREAAALAKLRNDR